MDEGIVVRKRNRDYIAVTDYIRSNQKSPLRIALLPGSPLGPSASALDRRKFLDLSHPRRVELGGATMEQARKETPAQRIGFDKRKQRVTEA